MTIDRSKEEVAVDETPRDDRVSSVSQMAAVGQLTSQVAHELNNILDGILRYNNLAIRALGSDQHDKVRSFLDDSKTGLWRMIHITKDLLEYSRSRPVATQSANIHDIVLDAVKLMQSAADRVGVKVICNVGDRFSSAATSASLFQVFCNLIKNSIDSMPGGGRLSITSQGEGSEFTLQFKDTGEGLTGDANKVFEPFYTTKAAGKGTGLGLAISRELVQRCGGSISAGNNADGGACFEVHIPKT